MIHFGEQFYGKVDVVPNLCHVATRFVHVNFVPILPTGSWIVLEANTRAQGPPATRTRFSLKSVLTAWLRAGLVLGAIAFGISAAVVAYDYLTPNNNTSATELVAAWGALAAIIAVLTLTYSFNRASYHRAIDLGAQLGLEAVVIEQLLEAALPKPKRSQEPAREPEGWERYS